MMGLFKKDSSCVCVCVCFVVYLLLNTFKIETFVYLLSLRDRYILNNRSVRVRMLLSHSVINSQAWVHIPWVSQILYYLLNSKRINFLNVKKKKSNFTTWVGECYLCRTVYKSQHFFKFSLTRKLQQILKLIKRIYLFRKKKINAISFVFDV